MRLLVFLAIIALLTVLVFVWSLCAIQHEDELDYEEQIKYMTEWYEKHNKQRM